MPQVLGAVILFPFLGTAAATAGFTVGAATISYASIVGTVALTAISYGLNALLAPRQSSLNLEGQQKVTRQPIPPRIIYYGLNKAAGPLGFLEARDGIWCQVVLISASNVNNFLEHWFNDELCEFGTGPDANRVINETFRQGSDNFPMRLFWMEGTSTQTTQPDLLALFPEITSNWRLRGVAYAVCMFESVPDRGFMRLYGGGVPNYRAVFEGRRVWDPRTDSNGYSANSALVILNYMTSPDGMRIPLSRITPVIEDWIHAANVCDDELLDNFGIPFKRYECHLGYSLQDPSKDPLAEMLKTCDGNVFMNGDGNLILQVGEWVIPDVHIEERFIVGYDLRNGSGLFRTHNVIRGRYVSPAHDFQEVDAQVLKDTASIDLLGGEKAKELSLSAVHSHYQARYIMKIEAARSNAEWYGTIRCSIYGLQALFKRFVKFSISELGLSAHAMEIESATFDPTGPAVIFKVHSMTSQAFDWNPAADSGVPPETANSITPSAISAPEDMSITVDYDNVGESPRFVVDFVKPTREDLTIIVLYRRQRLSGPAESWSEEYFSAEDWIETVYDPGGDDPERVELTTKVVQPYRVYELLVYVRTPSGILSAYSSLFTRDTINDSSTPSAPAVNASGGSSATFLVTLPNEDNIRGFNMWRKATNDFPTANNYAFVRGSANQDVPHTDSPSPGSYYYWVTTVHRNGNESVPAGPFNLTIT